MCCIFESSCILFFSNPVDFTISQYDSALAAADNAVMLLDAAKGLEPQTRKLFEVCRMRALPLFTFVNKMDRPAMVSRQARKLHQK